MACFQATRTKLSHKSYGQQRKSVSHVVLETYKIFDNSIGCSYLNKLCLRKVSRFASLHSYFLLRFNFLRFILRDSSIFFCFAGKFPHGHLKIDTPAHAPIWPLCLFFFTIRNRLEWITYQMKAWPIQRSWTLGTIQQENHSSDFGHVNSISISEWNRSCPFPSSFCTPTEVRIWRGRVLPWVSNRFLFYVK